MGNSNTTQSYTSNSMEELVKENLFPSAHNDSENCQQLTKLLSTNAEEIAQVLCKERALKNTQIRRFYNEVQRLDRQLRCQYQQDKSTAFEKILPHIKLLRARVAFASSRENGSFTPAFRTFLDKRIEQITSIEDFRAFLLHFEAVLGFFSYKNRG
ncbi:type III-A CRISPR-associated protein Csm2 [Desulfobaculum bizertense]|uniref:CRISPR system Cms protein Csm2 n=1 Tax=Desulfobaculum bizertense DSM 18034 TaxID=1121442 RepID=A0A1T4VSH8_9BACT|nr:type III-A CRISPR-associated protein Csm2 [Desulfobaculum bizertense]SKA67916.1 CRISPR-associated protein Csm2 [Desulfobaculum bizertense DSM 18034]